ncbi:MAG: type IV secretion system DNA-binding domain-containing protein [Candidatus Pacebacteria bacterium]|nr:type IV secretion system DNA-binding domain-containing protein [Candidatus Paceibacterota bacterium]
MQVFDINAILVTLIFISATASLISGALLVARSYLAFRSQINQSMNLDLEIIRVSKNEKPESAEGWKSNEVWKEEIGAMEQLLTALSAMKDTRGLWSRLLYGSPCISLEIANSASSEEIVFYIALPRKFRESIEKQVHSFFPNAVMEQSRDYNIFFPGSVTTSATLKLKHRHALPVRTYENMEVDPLSAITNALSKLEVKNEGAAIQLILKPAGTEWRTHGRRIAHEMQQGKRLKDVDRSMAMKVGAGMMSAASSAMATQKKDDPFKNDPKPVQLTPEEQELVKSIEMKASKTGYHVNIRLVASAATLERSQMILAQMENAFSQYENGDTNSFRIQKRGGKKEVAYNFIFRNFIPEEAVILNNEEIASIFHLPISTTETPKIKWLKSNAAAPPLDIPSEDTPGAILLGYNDYRGTKTPIRILDKDRRRHLYTIGQTGTGKSTFLQEMAKQDARAGRGFCFIDPHGDAIEDILTAIPKERAEDVIIFDPSDIERPFGLNMMEYDPAWPEQKTFVINELIGIFDQLYDLKSTGGPMFEQYMRNAMLLVMDDPESGNTLMEIPKVLADEQFRAMKIKKCTNPTVVDFWVNEAEKAGGEAALANMVPYITSKLTTFISNDLMRPIIAQQKSTINFRDVMDNKKILLINLSKGKIGEINARLLGMVVVGKILMNALARADTPEDQRTDFYLYLDEFQNVTTNSISQILSEARKYRLVLVLAHQFIAQLKEEISKAVFGNVGSMMIFRVGAEDAEFLEKNFLPTFGKQDLVNVDNRQGFARILINDLLTKPFNMATYPPTRGDLEVANALKELSRLKYGRDKNIVNREIMDRTKLKAAV